MFKYAKQTIACTVNVKKTRTKAEYHLTDVFLIIVHISNDKITAIAGRIVKGFYFVAKVTRLIIM